jgi:hypothetical protein
MADNDNPTNDGRPSTPNARLIAYHVSEFILRSAETISQAFEHDYETAILFMAISNRNAQFAMEDPELRARYASYADAIPTDIATPISRMALARSTGLPRETVRRKVAKLIQKGWVVETKDGLRADYDLTKDPTYVHVIMSMAPNLRRLFAGLTSAGAMGIIQNPPAT